MGLSVKAPWRSGVHKYRTLDDLHYEKEGVPWYWRLVAQVASWMILGGYLILPSTFDSDPQLRFSKGVLAIIIVALLTGGYSLTALLLFACPSILFRLDNIYLPVFSVSLFGFLATMYAFATSPRYSFSDASAPISLALAIGSAGIYGILALTAQRKISRMTVHQETNPYHRSMSGTPTGMWQDPIYYQNFVQNMHPAARSPSIWDGASSLSVAPPTDDDLVNQQMARLLKKNDPGPSLDAPQNETFRLEWPPGAEDEEMDQFGRRRMRTFSGSNSGFLSPGQVRGYRSNSDNTRDGRPGAWARIGQVVRPDRGRQNSDRTDGRGHRRTQSREERRREIELQTLP